MPQELIFLLARALRAYVNPLSIVLKTLGSAEARRNISDNCSIIGRGYGDLRVAS